MSTQQDAELSLVLYVIASELDRPSVYMGGPSLPSKNKARRIIESLNAHGVKLIVTPNE